MLVAHTRSRGVTLVELMIAIAVVAMTRISEFLYFQF